MRARSETLTGRRLGEFVICELVGSGSFGEVYRAEQPSLAREAVIKVLPRRHRSTHTVVERFLREARLASRLDHPFAAHIYAFGAEPDGLLWIAMEYVRGMALDAWLTKHGPLSPRELSPFLDRLAEVIHSVHELGIIHRDIKPANIMVLPRAGKLLPKLLDLGIAKLVDSETLTAEPPQSHDRPDAPVTSDDTVTLDGTLSRTESQLTIAGLVLGSPPYMAPELWRSSATASLRSDLYALGVVLYRLITGVLPHRATSLAEFERAHTHDRVPPCEPPASNKGSWDESFAQNLDAFFGRALAKTPEDRFASALEMATQFRLAVGLGDSAENLPRLDATVCAAFMADAPEPVAASIAAVDAAQSAHQARDAVLDLIGQIARMLAILAVSAHSRVKDPERPVDELGANELLRELRRRSLSDSEWIDLGRRVCSAYRGDPDDHDIPPLIAWFADDYSRYAELFQLRSADGTRGNDQQLRAWLAHWLPTLTRALSSLTFLLEYAVIVLRDGRGEAWTGCDAPQQIAVEVTSPSPDEARPLLLDRNGRPLLMLWPLMQTAAPTPGAALALFVLEGPGRHGARLRTVSGFVMESTEVWDWLSQEILGDPGQIVLDDQQCPYLGLASFSIDQADRYFGREREAMECSNRLRIASLLCVVGPSGAGKSSFVQAALLPTLPADWRAAVIRPGTTPIATLEAQLRKDTLQVLVIDQLEELFTLCADPVQQRAFVTALSRALESGLRVIMTVRDDFLVRAQSLFGSALPLTPYILIVPEVRDLVRMITEPARRAGYSFDDPELPNEMAVAVAERPGALPLLSFTAAKLWEHRDVHFRRLTRRAHESMGGIAGALAQHADVVIDRMPREQQRIVREMFRHLVSAEGTRVVVSRVDLLQIVGASGEPALERLLEARLLTASEGDGTDQIEIIHETLVTAWPRFVNWRREDSEGARLRDQLRAAARQWHDRERHADLLWHGDVLLEYRLWRSKFPGKLTGVEEAFASASLAAAARTIRRRRILFSAAIALLVAGLVVMIQLRRTAAREQARAEISAQQARQRLVESYEEQGRKFLLDANPLAALVFLNEAFQLGAESPSLRYMLERTIEPLRAQRAALTHGAEISTIDLSPDGGLAVTAGVGDAVKVWDVGSSRLRYSLSGHGANATAALSPDGRVIATGAENGLVQLWDAATGHLLRTLRGHTDWVVDIAFSRDSQYVISSSRDATARVWAVSNGVEVGVLRSPQDEHAVLRVPAISPDGSRIVTGCWVPNLAQRKCPARLWTLHGELVAELPSRPGGEMASVLMVRFSPAGDRVVTANFDSTARVWDARDGRPITDYLVHENSLFDASFSPDGTRIVTAGRSGVARVWNADTGALLATLTGHTGDVNRAAFLPDGMHIVTASSDGTSKIWDVTGGSAIATFVQGSPTYALAMVAHAQLLATGSADGSIRLWDLRARQRVARLALPEPNAASAWLAENAPAIHRGIVARACPTGITIWAADDGHVVQQIRHDALSSNAQLIANGDLVVAGDREGQLLAWDVATGQQRWVTKAHNAPVRWVRANPTKSTVASIDDAGGLAMWQPASGSQALTSRIQITDEIMSFTMDPDANRVAVFKPLEKKVEVFDLATLHPHVTLTSPNLEAVHAFAFSPDGRSILAGGTGAVYMWRVDDGKLEATFPISGGSQPRMLAFDRDGRLLAIGDYDGTLSVWSVPDHRMLGQQVAHGASISALSFSADDELLVSASQDRTVRVWDTSKLRELTRIIVSTKASPHAVFLSDDRLAISDEANIDIWMTTESHLSRSELSALVRCRVPLALQNGTLRPVLTHCD